MQGRRIRGLRGVVAPHSIKTRLNITVCGSRRGKKQGVYGELRTSEDTHAAPRLPRRGGSAIVTTSHGRYRFKSATAGSPQAGRHSGIRRQPPTRDVTETTMRAFKRGSTSHTGRGDSRIACTT